MHSPTEVPFEKRLARFELFEERLALSAQSVAPLLPGSQLDQELDQHYEEVTPLLPVGDFLLEDALTRVGHHDNGLTPLLADAHQASGVQYVHETYGFGGQGQTVAIIDSGIAYDHLALGGGFGQSYRVVGGYDFAEGDADPYDDGPAGFHGTHVAGIVGSDDLTHQGVAPDVDLVALRVFDDQGAGYFSWVEDALNWVHEHRHDFANPITTVNLSLGTTWNADSVPNWATLEDEFLQLKNDGIFIAVSAGNSFQDYNDTGLSYPAASPYVVPVASVDADGSFSSFSQRNDRVLAAPGRSITSTVPDHVFGGDGNPNDFGAASGTSMAAPYVAGASTLVRQAMEFLGTQGITQDTIYDHLRSTADLFFDSATSASYHRINLQSALDALMPEDDFASSLDDAHSLGSLSGETNVSGLIGTLDDADFFTFTAGGSGSVTINVDSNQDLRLDVFGADGSFDEGSYSFAVVAGQTYSVSIQTTAGQGLGFYDAQLTLETAATDLGSVAFQLLADQSVNGSQWYQLTTTQAGTLTVEALLGLTGGDVELQVYDAASRLLVSSGHDAGDQRVDVTAEANQTFLVQLSGVGDDVDLRLTNLLSTEGDAWQLSGTAGDDTFVVDVGNSSISVNGVYYELDASVAEVNIDGAGGADTMQLLGSQATETVVFRPGVIEAILPEQTVEATSIETIYAYSGGGGDSSYFHDSAGSDRFFAGAQDRLAYMSGDDFYHYAKDYTNVYAYSTAGGEDSSYFYDSAADDRFFVRAQDQLAYMSGQDYFTSANGFQRVHAYATAGGEDSSYFYDSTGNDRFFVRAQDQLAYMSGQDYFNSANGFERVHAYATAGGEDSGYFYDSAADDRFFVRAQDQLAYMSGQGYYNYTHGFRNVYAYATAGGDDSSYFYDSANDDRFFVRAQDQLAYMSGQGYYNYSHGFHRVYAYATAGGEDSSYFYDSADDDRFVAQAEEQRAYMTGEGYFNYAHGFDHVNAYATAGGDDRSFFYDSVDNDQFYARATDRLAYMVGRDFYHSTNGFEHVHAYATAGGDDRSYFDEIGSSDTLYGRDDYAQHNCAEGESCAFGFDVVTAAASAGEAASADVEAVDYLFETEGDWE